MKILLGALSLSFLLTSAAFAMYVCPGGSYANEGPCKLCPDGSYIGEGDTCQFVPDEKYKEPGNADGTDPIKKMGHAENLGPSHGSVSYPGESNSSNNVDDVFIAINQAQVQQQKVDQRITVAFNEYLRQGDHKAFAYSNDGFYGWCVMKKTEKEAKDCSLINCAQYRQKGQNAPCYIWAFDETVIGRQ